ncbi:hypothetical protein R83H12_01524 [Fibrobacteria bacterium R8-3-H12]
MTTPKLTALFLAAFAITLHAQTAATIPYSCDFENATENANWTLENGSQTNQWFIGTAAKNAGSNGLYISNDNGTTNAATSGYISYVYAYRSINFTAAGNYTVSFNWRSSGLSTSANLRAFLVPDNVTTLVAGNANGNTSSMNNVPTGWIAVSDILSNQPSAWQSFSASVNVPSIGTYKLVFFWKNTSLNNPPAAVDNILVAREGISATVLNSFGILATPYTQPAAQTVTITNNSAATVTLSQPTSTNYDIGTLSATSLAAGATATFTVQPKASLAAGTYGEAILISGNDGIGTTAIANFNVAANTYYITGGSGSFSASKASAGGTAINNGTGAIQAVIDAIRADAAGNPVVIQFGNGSATLDIGSDYIRFNGTDTPAWGAIAIAGKITSSNSSSSYGTIYLTGNASISSTADIANTYGNAVYNNYDGTVTISGGTVQAMGNRYAVYNNSGGKIIVSGSATVTSANTSTTGGTIVNSGTGTVEITGGTVTNTASNGNAVYNRYLGSILLSGNPTITGTIMKASTGVLSVDNNFNPSKTYTLGFTNTDGVAVKDGASKKSFFTLANTTLNGFSLGLIVQGNDLVISVTDGYTVANSGSTYTITKGTGSYTTIQTVIDSIKTLANSNNADVTIQFGSGNNDTLDIAEDYFSLDGWYKAITLTGKITSKRNNYIIFPHSSITSTADIINTVGSVIYNSNATVNISGGTVQATNIDAVRNASSGKIIVSGNAKVTSANTSSSSGTIVNSGTGTVEITGGTVENTSNNANSRAIYNASTGTINITGGLVFAYGPAVSDAISGAYNAFSGNPAIIAWDNSTSPYTYTAFTSTSIAKAPEAATAVWKNEGESKGIRYANGTNTGFIPLNVTVSKIQIAKPTAPVPTYNGTEQTASIAANDAYTISGNTGTNAGSYSATVALKDKANYEWADGTTADLTLPWAIAKAKITKPTAATSLVYTGSEQSAEIAANAAYTITGDIAKTNAGNYSATVALKDKANYEWEGGTTADLSLPWSISKASGLAATNPHTLMISTSNTDQNTFSLHDIALNKSENDHGTLSYSLGAFTDGGNNILASAPTLDGSTLKYTGTGKTSGTATQVINIASDNYENATVTITFQATPKTTVTISGLTAATNLVYDGTPKLGVTGTATSEAFNAAGLVYEYEGMGITGSTTTQPTNAGDYTLTVSVPDSDPDYTGFQIYEFTIAIAQATKPAVATATTLTYNGTEQTAPITANPAAYTITGDIAKTNAGSYSATVALKDKPNREWDDGTTADLELEWTISKATYDLAGVSFPSQSLTYTGEPQSIYISGTLPAGVTVSYTGNGQIAINETGYAVTATFAGDTANYEPIPPLTATMIINNKQTYDLAGITFADKTAVYDGTPQSILISGTLPDGVTVSYTGNGQTAVGTYTITATFAVANPSTHNTPAPKTAELKIVEPTEIDPIFTNRENPRIGRIGVQTTANSILLSNLPPNAKVEVYNLQGKRIYSSHSGNSQILKILVQTGVYVVKTNTHVAKVAVR